MEKEIKLLQKEKASAQKSLEAKRTAKEKLLRELHKLKERATKRKTSNDNPMAKIRYDQMQSALCTQEHKARLEMSAATNSRKHTVNGKAQSRAMESIQPLLQTMASGGGCYGGGQQNGAWNAGGMIRAL